MYNCCKYTCKYLAVYKYIKLLERAAAMLHEPQEERMIQKGVNIGSKTGTNKGRSYKK